jgi:hypothetical protein
MLCKININIYLYYILLQIMNAIIDITTIITYVSDITNNKLLPNTTNRETIKKQIIDEETNPILDKLKNEINKYDNIYISQSIYNKTCEMINLLGNDNEKQRFNLFTTKFQIINDINETHNDILNKLKFSLLEKGIVFPAEKFNYDIITGNATLIKKIVAECGDLNLKFVLHSSRSLFGKKN